MLSGVSYNSPMPKIAKIHATKTPKRIHYLVEWLEKRRMIPAELVRVTGHNKGTISKWCSGALPSEKSLFEIANALSIEPNDLFRHPDDDWLARMFRDRSQEELSRMVETLRVAFPMKEGTNG